MKNSIQNEGEFNPSANEKLNTNGLKDSDFTQNLMPLETTTAIRKECDKRVLAIYTQDKPLYEKANEVIRQLGLGGLWRGQSACVLIVATAISEGRK